MAENHLHHGKGIASTQRSSAWPSHATLSLSLFSFSLSHCARVLATTLTPRAEKPFSQHSQQRLVGCSPARLPDTANTHQGISTSGLPRCGYGGRGLALHLLLREKITLRGEEGEREGERGESGGVGGRGTGSGRGMASTPHTPSPQPFNQLFFFLITRSVWDTRGPGNEHMLRYGYTGWAARACVRVRHLENGAVHRI